MQLQALFATTYFSVARANGLRLYFGNRLVASGTSQ